MKKVIDFNRLPKQEYIKPTMCVVKLMNGSSLLVGSATSYDNFGDFPFGTYEGDDETIDEDDVI